MPRRLPGPRHQVALGLHREPAGHVRDAGAQFGGGAREGIEKHG